MRPIHLALILLPMIAAPAAAQELRPFCPNRPSLGSSACITDVDHAMLEVGVADWQRDRSSDGRTDTALYGDTLVRVGVASRTEVQVGWTIVGHERTRDAAGGAIERRTRLGDVMLAVRQNLVSPDGSGFSLAVQPYASVPVGRQPIGAGTWGAGAVIPIGYELTDTVQLQVTGEVDAAPDEAGSHRHLAYSAIGGIAVSITDAVSGTAEISAERDEDPSGHQTELLAALSGAYVFHDRFQLDGGTAIGLNSSSPDVRVFVGFARRF